MERNMVSTYVMCTSVSFGLGHFEYEEEEEDGEIGGLAIFGV